MHSYRFASAPAVWRRVLVLSIVMAISLDAEAPPTAPPKAVLDRQELYAIAPYLVQIVNLSVLDPVLAASMVPEGWIDSLNEGALAVEAEVAVPVAAATPDPPVAWPIGPWTDPDALAASISALQPFAVATLYKALEPRFTANCRAREVTPAACRRALRSAVSRMSASVIHARTLGRPVERMTPTQREFARLGEPVVLATRRQLKGLGTALWGAPDKPMR